MSISLNLSRDESGFFTTKVATVNGKTTTVRIHPNGGGEGVFKFYCDIPIKLVKFVSEPANSDYNADNIRVEFSRIKNKTVMMRPKRCTNYIKTKCFDFDAKQIS